MGGNVSDDELILRLLVPEKDIAAMRAAGAPKRDYEIRGKKSASVALIETLMNQAQGTHIEYQSEDFSLVLERP
jgi:oxaloacetate decarboxylase (Na+ extruding) subunit alpha